MPTNANTFNSRVTSEALEAKFRQVFPSQGGAELSQDLFASGVIQPVIDFSSVAEGSNLPLNLQTAWDFSTGAASRTAVGTTTLINNTGFWLVDVSASIYAIAPSPETGVIRINDGATTKPVWGVTTLENATVKQGNNAQENQFVVFLRAGDSLELNISSSGYMVIDAWYRQIADVYGNLVNPLGYTFS